MTGAVLPGVEVKVTQTETIVARTTVTFQIKEGRRMEFRAEGFNLTNGFHPNNPTSDFDSNTFGQVTTARDPRIMQFALKYIF
jgi:hypothetical protein